MHLRQMHLIAGSFRKDIADSIKCVVVHMRPHVMSNIYYMGRGGGGVTMDT